MTEEREPLTRPAIELMNRRSDVKGLQRLGRPANSRSARDGIEHRGEVMTVQNVQNASGSGALLASGTILLLAGVAGMAIYLTLAIGGTPGRAADEGLTQGLLVWAAALSLGIGVTLLAIGAIKGRHRSEA
jgi:hypothetical protein